MLSGLVSSVAPTEPGLYGKTSHSFSGNDEVQNAHWDLLTHASPQLNRRPASAKPLRLWKSPGASLIGKPKKPGVHPERPWECELANENWKHRSSPWSCLSLLSLFSVSATLRLWMKNRKGTRNPARPGGPRELMSLQARVTTPGTVTHKVTRVWPWASQPASVCFAPVICRWQGRWS